jgi:hypothetical protein
MRLMGAARLMLAGMTMIAACLHAGAQESRPEPRRALVSGTLILPSDVKPTLIDFTFSPSEFGGSRSATTFEHEVPLGGSASLEVHLRDWFFGTPGRESTLVSETIVVAADGSIMPPVPVTIDLRPLVRVVRFEVQDEAGTPLPDVQIGPVVALRVDTGWRRWGQVTPDRRLDKFEVPTDRNGKAAVLVPVDEETPELVIFRPGYRSVRLSRPGSINRVVLRKGVPVRVHLPPWIALPTKTAEYLGSIPIASRDATIDLVPPSDQTWWMTHGVSLYDEQATGGGGRAPRSATFFVEPGVYKPQLSLVPHTLLRLKYGDQGWRILVEGSPQVVTIPDTRETVELTLDFDRAAFDKSGFAKYPEVKPDLGR